MKLHRRKVPIVGLLLEISAVHAHSHAVHNPALLEVHESLGADAVAECLRKQAQDHALGRSTLLSAKTQRVISMTADHLKPEGEAGHHAEAHHGHHGEGGEHEHEAPEAGAISLACFLMGGFPALMIVFYLVNNPVLGIRVATWRVLNMTTSIFVAVLMYGTLKETVFHLLEPSFHAAIGITLAIFVLLFVATHAILFKLKSGDQAKLQASATILAHISGFAAMYGFADCQEVKLFEELDAAGICMLILVAGTVIAILSYAMSAAMSKIAADDGVVTEEEERWIDVCEETDDDVFCLAISFLTVLLLRFLIRGKVMPYEPGEVGNVTQSDANILLAISSGFVLIVAVVAIAMKKFHHAISSPLAKRAFTNVLHLSSMTMAWCILFWAEWQLYVFGWESTVMGGCLVVAVVMTLFSFLCVFLLNHMGSFMRGSKMAQRAMNSIELALGVLVGFSWERAFDVGFEEIEKELEHQNKHAGGYLVVLMSLVLFVTVAPAWRWYILPKALQMEDEAQRACRELKAADLESPKATPDAADLERFRTAMSVGKPAQLP